MDISLFGVTPVSLLCSTGTADVTTAHASLACSTGIADVAKAGVSLTGSSTGIADVTTAGASLVAAAGISLPDVSINLFAILKRG